MVRQLNRFARLYFYPVVAANLAAMTLAVGGEITKALIFSLSISFLASFGFLINDLCDVEIDKRNKAGHFEDSAKSTLHLAVISSGAFLLAGLGVAYSIGPSEFMLSILIAAGLFAYTVLLRRVLLVPNLLAGALATSPIWIPIAIWSETYKPEQLVFAFGVVALIVSREILMDVRDVKGDIEGGRGTISTLFGVQLAKFVGVVLTIGASIPIFFVTYQTLANASLLTQLIGMSVAGLVLSQLILPAMRTMIDPGDSRTSIQRYVKMSRRSMALLPVLILVLWYF